jgi:hypothetical protein
MPQQFNSNTFKSVYKDDFADSAGYHRVLFNSGRPLQARELTQLQTILQTQITRFASNIFLDGAAVSPKSSGAQTSIQDYVIVEELTESLEGYIGAEFTGAAKTGTNGLKFVVTHVEAASGGDYPILYGRYTSVNQAAVSTTVQPTLLAFSEAETLASPGLTSLTVRTKTVSEPASVGKGTLFSMQSAEFFVQGFFVFAPKQTVVIAKHSDVAQADVGFEVTQDIVTVADDEELYDNQGARPNLSSPGADRFRITLTLINKSQIADELDFLSFATVRDSKIIQIKEGTSGFNQIEKRLAVRQEETTGNFVVHDFEVELLEKDSASLTYFMRAQELGNSPTAYLNGYRLTQKLDAFLDVDKPTSFVTDSATSSTFVYENFVSVTGDSAGQSAFGNYNPTATTNDTQQQHALWNVSNTQIGTARVKSVKKNAETGEDAYRIYLFDVQMEAGTNFRDVTKIGLVGNTASQTILVDREDSQTFVQNADVNSSLVKIPGGRVKQVSNVQYTVQRQVEATINGGAEFTITCNSGEEFTDEGQWIFLNKTTNTIDEITLADIDTTSVALTATITTGGTVSTDVYVAWYYVRKIGTSGGIAAKSKTYNEGWFTATRSSADSDFKFTLEGGSAISGLYDGVELLEAYTEDSNGSKVLHAVEFDGGQRDNFYSPSRLIASGIDAAVTTVRAKVSYFEWGAGGDYFSANSYDIADSTWFDYGDIPTFVSRQTGTSYELHDYFDFRSKLDPTAASMSASDRFELPRSGDQISHGVETYNTRIDNVVLTYDGDTFAPILYVKKGEEAQEPLLPTAGVNEMVLFSYMLGGNTKNVNDALFAAQRYPRYTMSDIDAVNERVKRLEETVSLSVLEAEASNLIELDGTGNVRSKTGFFVDDFTKGLALTASEVSPNYIDDASFITQTLDVEESNVFPKQQLSFNEFQFDTDNQYSARGVGAKSNIVQRGDLLMLDYVDVLDSTLSQPLISWKSSGTSEEHGYYNVNPFNVFTGEGVVRLRPSSDIWFDVKRLPTKNHNGGTITTNRSPITNFIPRTTVGFTRTTSRTTSQRIGPNEWRNGIWAFRALNTTTSTTMRTSTTTRVKTRVISDETVVRDLGDRTVRIDSIPFIRQRRVLGKAEGLRPNTRYWLYFDGIRMDQWTLARSKAQHDQDIVDGVHRAQYPATNVRLKQHPLTTGSTSTTLIADANGDLYFDLWVPNTSLVPIPRSSNFSYARELSRWTKAVRAGVKRFGQNDPRCYDNAGWKFRTGTKNVKLLDISVNEERNALSRARTAYVASGTQRTVQRNTITTRHIVVEDFIDTTTTTTTTQTVSDRVVFRRIDPLAQTFAIEATSGVPGVFVTKIDVYVRSAPAATDEQVPLQLQVREVRDGTPMSGVISEQHRIYKPASEVRAVVESITDLTDYEEVISKPVTFEFAEPIYLTAGEEFALVLLAECDDYEVFVAETYGLILGRTDKRVSKQPAMGSLFLSQNGSTWTPKQNQDMTYRIHTAKFKTEGVANFFPSTMPRHLHNYDTSLSVDSADLTRFRVLHPGHNLGVGDRVNLTGLDAAGVYLGVAAGDIMNQAHVVDSADVNGYMVSLASGGPFTTGGVFGADSVESNQAFNVDRFAFNAREINFLGTNTNWFGSFVSGVSHSRIGTTATADPRFDIDDAATPGTNSNGLTPLSVGETTKFRTPRYLANSDQVVNDLSGEPSIIIGCQVSTNQTSAFGGVKAAQQIANGYISDVTPIIDTQAIGGVVTNYVIDNQAVDSASRNNFVNNAPADYVPETHPILGTTPSKHLTKVVSLEEAANGVRVFLEMHKPPSASFELYYRTARTSEEDIYDNSFVRIDAQNNVADHVYNPTSDTDVDFSDYKYLIGGVDGDLDDFAAFQLKIVFKTTNTCEIPILRSIRAIAVI